MIECLNQIREKFPIENLPATPDNIFQLQKQMAQKLNSFLPKSYLNLLENVNGIICGSSIMYGIDQNIVKTKEKIVGILAVNQTFFQEANITNCIFFAEDGEFYYVFDKHRRQYNCLQKNNGEVVDTYSNFEELFAQFSKNLLKKY